MEITKIPLSDISLSPMNPRKTIDEESIRELAENIAHQGLLQPITVRPIQYADFMDGNGEIITLPERYEVVCGERRYRACSLNGDADITSIVREMTDDEAFDAMITENLQRKDVDPIEESFAFTQLMAKGATAEEIAARFGKSVRFVQDRMKLGNLIPQLVEWVRSGKLPLVSAQIAAKLSPENQEKYASAFSYQKSAISKESTLNFVGNLFTFLRYTPWSDEKEPFTGGCGVACSECPHNSANAGCLFWEMKAEPKDAKCTVREKILEKTLAYFRHRLRQIGDTLVLKGYAVERGKTPLIDNGSYFSGADVYEEALQVIEEEGFEAFKPERFGGKCYYREDDERLQKMLASGEVVKCLAFSLSVNGGRDIFTAEYHYRTEKSSDEATAHDKEAAEASVLAQKYAQTQSDATNGAAKTLIAALQESADGRPISKSETAMLAMVMLLDSENETKRAFGLNSYGTDDAYRLFLGAPELQPAIIRKWLYENLSGLISQSWRHSQSADLAALHLAEESLSEEWSSVTEKAKAAVERKRAKIGQRLAEIGYGTDGRKLEFKDTTHYAAD